MLHSDGLFPLSFSWFRLSVLFTPNTCPIRLVRRQVFLRQLQGSVSGERKRKIISGLHSIIISKTRRAAIIDGQTVELGEEHGNAKLVEVNEGNVVLAACAKQEDVDAVSRM